MTQDELLARKAALERAKYSPTLEAEYDGKKIRFRSFAEITNELSALNNELADLAGTPAPRVLRSRFLNGLGRGPFFPTGP